MTLDPISGSHERLIRGVAEQQELRSRALKRVSALADRALERESRLANLLVLEGTSYVDNGMGKLGPKYVYDPGKPGDLVDRLYHAKQLRHRLGALERELDQ